MRTKEEILKSARERIARLEYFGKMLGLTDAQHADLTLMKELVALVGQPEKPRELIAPCKGIKIVRECPACGQWIYDKSYKFCPECGQEFL